MSPQRPLYPGQATLGHHRCADRRILHCIEGSLQPSAGEGKTEGPETVWWGAAGGKQQWGACHRVPQCVQSAGRWPRAPCAGATAPTCSPHPAPHTLPLHCPQERRHRGLVSCDYELNGVAAVCWEADVDGAAGPAAPTARCQPLPPPAVRTPGPRWPSPLLPSPSPSSPTLPPAGPTVGLQLSPSLLAEGPMARPRGERGPG